MNSNDTSPSEQFDTITDDQTDPNADANAADANAEVPQSDDAIVEQVDAENGFVVPDGDDGDDDLDDEGDGDFAE